MSNTNDGYFPATFPSENWDFLRYDCWEVHSLAGRLSGFCCWVLVLWLVALVVFAAGRYILWLVGLVGFAA